MKHFRDDHLLFVIAACAVCALLPQCGGLKQEDFEQVNVTGFDAKDNESDHNDYAYSMEYFKAEGADDGYLYVGTLNNMGNLMSFYIETLLEGGDILDAPVRPPEILRYRPDWGPTEWEVVFDYRDVEAESNFETIGFRFMTVVQLPDPEKQGGLSSYLYAATQGEDSVLWRTKTGNPGDWELAFTYDELGGSIRWIEELNGRMYLAVAYDSFGDVPPPGEIWVSDDGLNFWPIMQDGFGDPNNRGVQALIAWQGWIYAGTKNDVDGFDVWKLRPTAANPEEYEYVRVVSGGGPSAHNENAGMPILFEDKLYFGTQLYIGGVNPTSGNALQGCDIIRINKDDSWETIVGPNSLSGYRSGFNHFTNAYLWWMEEHDGWLYASTFDNSTVLSQALANFEEVIEFLQGSQEKDTLETAATLLNLLFDINDFYQATHAGGDIYKSPNGIDWYLVTRDGLGVPENYGWRTMKSCPDGYLYVGSANISDGVQIWRGKVTPSEERAEELLEELE
jgi:hypothetical protein